MEAFTAGMERAFLALAQIAVTFLEFSGVAVLVISSVKALISFFRKDEHIRLNLAQGIALALEFKLGGEVLRTTIVHEIYEVLLVGAIILLRAALTLLIHWEINVEEKKIRALSELKEK